MTEQVTEQVQPNRDQLKVMAYQQKVAEQENQIADLRVDVTILSQELQRAREELFELQGPGQETEDEVSEEAEPKKSTKRRS